LVTEILEEGNLLAIHAKRVTLMPRDVQAVLRIKKKYERWIDITTP
jgi:histone H3/H4